MLKKTPLSSRTYRRIAQDIFLLDKPVGPTSFAFIQQYKEYLEGEYGAIEKIGHAGTLDPLASGAMIVGVNQGTKHLDTYLKLGKSYVADIALTGESATGDAEGPLTRHSDVSTLGALTTVQIRQVVSGMVGVLHLEPPAFSAIKQKGEALYKKARRGEKVDIAPRAMVVHQSRLLAYDPQTKVAKVFFDVESGVYIRSLAVELARRLGVGVYAHLAGLRRVSIGDYSLLARSVFAGGCFWCTTAQFSPLIGKGVIDVISGYTGGSVPHPTYDQVVTGTTGHREAALVIYDPTIVSYEMLLERFWRHIDPTDAGGQFADRGHQYTTALYYSNDAEKAAAHLSKSTLEASAMFSAPIATEILPATDFYPAEEYHQKYHEKEAFRYSMYREGSGRADFVRKTWGDDAVDHETTTEDLGNDIASVI